MTLEWTLNVQENILSTFCFSLQFLYRDKTLRVCFLSSFFPKFWRGQIVPLTVFLRDNFNCSAGLAQWRGLAQTLKIYVRLKIYTNPDFLARLTVITWKHARCNDWTKSKNKPSLFYSLSYPLQWKKKNKVIWLTLHILLIKT